MNRLFTSNMIVTQKREFNDVIGLIPQCGEASVSAERNRAFPDFMVLPIHL